jgi:hypothetical protein
MGEPNARRWQQNKRKMEASDGGQGAERDVTLTKEG